MSERGQESSGVLEGSEDEGGQQGQQEGQEAGGQEETSQNQGDQARNVQQAQQRVAQMVHKPKEPFKLLPRGYGFNPLILLLVFSIYFLVVAVVNFANVLGEYPQVQIPSFYNYVAVQKLSDMQFNQQKFNITGQYYTLDANNQQQLQISTYINISGTFDQTNQNWYLTSLLIPFRVNTNTMYNITISYGFPDTQPNVIDIVIPSQIINQANQEYALMRPNTIILQAQENFNRSYLSYDSTDTNQVQDNQYFVGIKSVDIRIFYRDSKKIKLYTVGVNENYSKFQSSLAMLICGVIFLLLSMFLMMYGFSRIGQQMIVIKMYNKAKEGGSSYLHLQKPSFESSGAMWRKYNRTNLGEGVNQYPPLMYE